MLFGNKENARLKNLLNEANARIERLENHYDYKIRSLNSEIKNLQTKVDFLESADELYLAERENDIAKEFEKKYAGLSAEVKSAVAAKVVAEAAKRESDGIIKEMGNTISHLKEINKFMGTKIPDFKEIDLSKIGTADVTVHNSSSAK
ncbi:hypothetical protein KBA63_00690 [Candidatus Woesebacteria bacterium]|nr:hypothetical protein [Candidatus Woesebacteria bacterium]